MSDVAGVARGFAPKNHVLRLRQRETKARDSYPKRMSGFGMEGWEERKEMMVWA